MTCCSVGRRADATDIDAALSAARTEGAESLGAISRRLGIPKGTLSKHRSGCLGKRPETVAGTEVETAVVGPETPFRVIPPSPRDDPMTSPRRLITVELEAQCMALRVKGAAYASIAAKVGVDEDTAIDAVERVLLRTRRGADARADAVRRLEIERCDRLVEALWDRATDPSMATVDVPANTESGVKAYDGQDKAIDRIVKVMERRAKLEGLDAPTGPSTVVNVLQAPGVMDLLREVRGFLQGRAPDLLPELDDHLRGIMTARRGLPPGRVAGPS